VGFKTVAVDYVREARVAGRSKFNGWKLWNFALEGVTSFSTAPLRIWTYLGLVVAGLAFVYGLYIILHTLIVGIDVPGYASLLTAVLFLGGIQLIGLGVLGEYVGRVYNESKQRPVYLVRKTYDGEDRPV
jgi:glycosyltransferase involved in cell wall biosynthesis